MCPDMKAYLSIICVVIFWQHAHGLCLSDNSTEPILEECFDRYPNEEDYGCAVSCSLVATGLMKEDGKPDMEKLEKNTQQCKDYPEDEKITFNCIKEHESEVKPGLERCKGYLPLLQCFTLETEYEEDDDSDSDDSDGDESDKN